MKTKEEAKDPLPSSSLFLARTANNVIASAATRSTRRSKIRSVVC